MFRPRQIALLTVGLLLVTGCNQQEHDDLTFRRGVLVLAAGSPKSAIPFFTQVIASSPEAPQPRAMLAMAYALDLQPDLAIRQAGLVRRDPKTDGPPGWECVALGIAAMSQHNPSRAADFFEKARSAAGTAADIKTNANQWLVLALLLKGDEGGALKVLRRFGRANETRTTALLWSVLIHGHNGRKTEAAKALSEVASEVVGQGRLRSLQTVDSTKADDQDLCDAGIAAVGQGKLDRAERLFTALHQRNANARDAQVWLALLAVTQGNWNEVTDRLKTGCRKGPRLSRSLANDLFSIICALEDRPHAMIQHLLVGRRLAGQNRLRIHVPSKDKPDSVWFSDKIN